MMAPQRDAGERSRKHPNPVLWGRGTLAALVLALAAHCRRDGIRQVPDPYALLPPTGAGTPNAIEVAVHVVSYPAAEAAARFEEVYWRGADEDLLPADLRARWRANGLRLGLTETAKVEAARALDRAPAPAGGAERALHLARIPHRGQTVLYMTPPVPAATYLFSLPGGRTAVRTFPGSAAALVGRCRLIDERTVYIEFGPRIGAPGRQLEEASALDFLQTEVALDADRALLVGLGSALPRTVGQALLTAGAGPAEGPAPSAPQPGAVQRLLVVTARPVHVPAGGAAGWFPSDRSDLSDRSEVSRHGTRHTGVAVSRRRTMRREPPINTEGRPSGVAVLP